MSARPGAKRARRLLLSLARPYLRLHLLMYNQSMRHSVFPTGEFDRVVAGPDPQRWLFIGELAVSGYGVLLEGMALPAQLAGLFGAQSGRGCSWENIASFDLTAARASGLVDQRAEHIDVVVVSLGIPDVLLVTGAKNWSTHLTALFAAIRCRAGTQCRIVLIGLPPMERFQPLPPIAREVISLQVAELNEASMHLAAERDDVTFVAFPDWGLGRMYMRDRFSFRRMHNLWAQAVAPYLAPAA